MLRIEKHICLSLFFSLFTVLVNAQEDSSAVRRDLIQPEKVLMDTLEEEMPVLSIVPSPMVLADETSYKLYLKGDWKTLSAFCKNTFEQGIDFFYLRMRAGVAEFEEQRYRLAAMHFERALKFDPSSAAAVEYLYYCYLYTERAEEARCMGRKIEPDQLKKIRGGARSSLLFAQTETGLKYTQNSDFENAMFTGLSVSHMLAKRISLLHSATYFYQREKRFNVQQSQYYLRLKAPLKNNFSFFIAGHALNIYVENPVSVPVYTTTTFQPPPPPGGGPQPPPQTLAVTYYTTSYTRSRALYPVVSGSIAKDYPLFSFQLGATFAKLDTAQQAQAHLGVTYYPFFHHRFYMSSYIYLHSENNRQQGIAVNPFIVLQPFPKLHLLAGYYMNTGNNISEYNAHLVTNSMDLTRQRFSAVASFRMDSNLWLYTQYVAEFKQRLDNKYNYTYHVANIGIKSIIQ